MLSLSNFPKDVKSVEAKNSDEEKFMWMFANLGARGVTIPSWAFEGIFCTILVQMKVKRKTKVHVSKDDVESQLWIIGDDADALQTYLHDEIVAQNVVAVNT